MGKNKWEPHHEMEAEPNSENIRKQIGEETLVPRDMWIIILDEYEEVVEESKSYSQWKHITYSKQWSIPSTSSPIQPTAKLSKVSTATQDNIIESCNVPITYMDYKVVEYLSKTKENISITDIWNIS